MVSKVRRRAEELAWRISQRGDQMTQHSEIVAE